ncbi:DUF4062 domain-containing protein [Pseudomonas sp. RL_105y_Pfl2_101]|uniref:DUF4062 domain-containing protein n=1 Tax=Pseudomonas sp. RL_105y_Pfl2_101 TaxID=3088708 RepID=UPI0030D80E53
MEKKYQVFVSSTYEDLKEERDQVIKAVLEMGHIPVGMEMFSAADDEQWKIIQRQIVESDYYIVVVANKYGSIGPSGISYTEMEYDFAIERQVPTLGFVLNDTAPWPSEKSESSAKAQKSLSKFKSKVKSKLVNFWDSKDDLHGKVSISLIKAITTNPRVGWARADEAVSPEVTRELSRLSAENAELRKHIEQLAKVVKEPEDEARNVVSIMHANSKKVQVRKTSSWKDATWQKTDLLDLFLAAAPNLINENSSIGVARNIALHLVGTKYYQNWPIGRNITSGLLADFVALEVVETSKKKHSVHDKDDYWCLTVLGKQVLKRARRIKLEEGIPTDDDE